MPCGPSIIGTVPAPAGNSYEQLRLPWFEISVWQICTDSPPQGRGKPPYTCGAEAAGISNGRDFTLMVAVALPPRLHRDLSCAPIRDLAEQARISTSFDLCALFDSVRSLRYNTWLSGRGPADFSGERREPTVKLDALYVTFPSDDKESLGAVWELRSFSW